MKRYRFHSLIHQFYKELIVAKGKGKDLMPLFRCLPLYLKQNRVKSNRLSLGIPWLTRGAVKFLDNTIISQMRVFEYGSGASTIYFQNRDTIVCSVEHDKTWYQIVKNKLELNGSNNVDLILSEPVFSPTALRDDILQSNKNDGYKNFDFSGYSQVVLNFPHKYFDLILIDGRVRLECLKNSMKMIKKGGLIILDNSDRYEYKNIIDMHKFKLVFQEYGLVEYDLFFAETSIFEAIY
ncbi:class I SAM-dependent methyltransferase [Algoriphagus chordae]|uniref:class I SAM-dependent methyltransferase n=1 Tax=Algoriphagus chordae TaxID=237019 RepID=UPI0011B4C5F3|nr:class I SAM-dependent methyltransferase [Algoriphagus chordae]